MADVNFTLDVPTSGAGASEDVSTAGDREKTFTWSGASVDSILAVETSADESTWARLVRLSGSSGVVSMEFISDFVRLVRWRGTGGAVDLSGQSLPVGATGPAGATGPTGPAGSGGGNSFLFFSFQGRSGAGVCAINDPAEEGTVLAGDVVVNVEYISGGALVRGSFKHFFESAITVDGYIQQIDDETPLTSQVFFLLVSRAP